jgi:hypothetical protein
MKKISLGMFLCLLNIGQLIDARIQRPGSERAFDKLLTKNELAVVLFYSGDSDQIRNQKQDFRSAEIADRTVAYIEVDLDKGRLAPLAAGFKVKANPTFVLIRNGRQYTEGGKAITKTGFLTPSEIRKFVRHYFGDYIADIREKKRERERERRESAPSVSFGVGYGYPYYGYPYYGYPYGYPYYGRPGFSFGVGF